MTYKYTEQLSSLLSRTKQYASQMHSHTIRPEHLLLAMIKDKFDFPHQAMRKLNVNEQAIADQLIDTIQNIYNRQEDNFSSQDNDLLDFNDQANTILRLANLEARMSHDHNVDVKHVLLAMLHDGINSTAKEIMEENNMNYDDVMNFSEQYVPAEKDKPVTDGLDLTEDDSEEEQSKTNNKGTQTTDKTNAHGNKNVRKTPILDNFSIDLTQSATEGKLDPCVGREKEIQRITEILCRRKKNNPILIGEPGVGKSAIVEGLAQLLSENKVSPILYNKRLVSLDLAGMVAGTKYRGQFEERIKALVKELEENPNVIIFIDEIHTIIGAGGGAGSMDAANMLKPALARGKVQCIGATTLEEYSKSIEKDGALERRFQKIIVQPSTSEETLQILQNLKKRYEEHHHVRYTDEALEACVKLTERYVTDRAFPDKAIDALDEVGARMHLKFTDIPQEIIDIEKEITKAKEKKIESVKNQNFELAAQYRDHQSELENQLDKSKAEWQSKASPEPKEISADDVADVVSMMTNIPVQRMAESDMERLRSMDKVLKNAVIAQDSAIDKMVKSIRRNRIGLRDPNHPIGVFMFLGCQVESLKKGCVEFVDVVSIELILKATQARSSGNAVLTNCREKARVIAQRLMVIEVLVTGSQCEQALFEHRLSADERVVSGRKALFEKPKDGLKKPRLIGNVGQRQKAGKGGGAETLFGKSNRAPKRVGNCGILHAEGPGSGQEPGRQRGRFFRQAFGRQPGRVSGPEHPGHLPEGLISTYKLEFVASSEQVI